MTEGYWLSTLSAEYISIGSGIFCLQNNFCANFLLFQVEEISSQVRSKEEENRLLQEEMELARKKQEEASQALIEASTTPKHHHLQVKIK